MQVGPYRTLDELGRGAAGVVYRARDADGKVVALKVLVDAQSANQRQRFEQEVAALAKLEHPHLVRLLDHGEHEGRPWLALEYVEGETLSERLRRGPLRVTRACQLVAQLASALGYLHEQGIVHRDLKPDNVLLTGERALLTDFGLVLDEALDASRLTATNAFLGTPGYWAPEQARADREAQGAHTDVYGLGAVLFACLTGRPPVVAESLPAYLETLRFRQVETPRALRPEVPAWLSALCMQCLSPDPAQRPPSAGDLARRLLVGEESGQGPVAVGPPNRGLQLALAAALPLTLLAGVGALWAALRVTPESRPDPVHRSEARDTAAPVGSDEDGVAARLAREGREALERRAYAQALSRGEALCALRPEDPRAHVLHAQALSGLGRYARAEAEIARVLELDPDSASAHLLRGRLRLALHADPEGALSDLDRALELDPELPEVHLARGGVLASQGRHAEALPDLRLAAERSGGAENQADRWNAYAVSLLALERWDEAERALDRALELEPAHVHARVNRAQARAALERPVEALEDADHALSLDPRSVSGHYLRGNLLGAFQRWADAAQCYSRALELEPGQDFALVGRGEAFLELRDWARAEADFTPVTQRNPGRVVPWYGLAKAQLAQPGKERQALESLGRVLELDPEHVPALSARARLLLRLGQPHAALADCDRALAQRPAETKLFALRARVYHTLGRPAEALADLERVVGGDATGADAARMTRATLLYELGRYDEALPFCRGVLAEAPEDANANVMLGRLHLARGDLDAARAQLRAMQERRPVSPLTWSLVFEVEPPAKAREVLQAFEAERERPSGWLLELLGRCDVLLGDYAEAERRFSAAAAYTSDRGVGVRLGLWVAVTRALRDDLPAARAAASRAIEQAGALPVRWEAAFWLAVFGDRTGLRRLDGRHPSPAIQAIAAAFLGDGPPDAQALLATCATPGQRAQVQGYLGILAEHRGDLGAARDHYAAALRYVAHGSRVLVWAKLRLAALEK